MTAELFHAEPEPEPLETSFSWPLDDEPEPAREANREHGPVFVDAVVREDELRPVIPASLRGPNLKVTAARAAGRTKHRVAYHVVRLPRYAVLGVLWGGWGVLVVAWRQLRWWWVSEQNHARQEAANRADGPEWRALHNSVRSTRLFRGLVLGAELLGVVALVVVVHVFAPVWVTVALVVVVLTAAAKAGRPVDRPIVTPAVVAPRFRVLTADVVLRAYYAAKLGHPDKPDQQIRFGSVMARDGEGSRVVVDLPHGRTFSEVIDARERIASGLDVALSQVFITRDKTSNRRHTLWVADRDPLAIAPGRTPLLNCRPTDIWQPAPWGMDERGQLVTLDMMWVSILIGAQPRQGKSFAARALGLYAALDPYVMLTVFDGKGSPDWRKFRLVADRCGFGLAMTRDGDPLELFVDALRALKADVQDRYQRLSELPVDICPEGKLTREIARDPRYRMPVRLVIIDECQEYFDTGDRDLNKEIGGLLVFLVKVAPAAGVIVVDATQKPSGVGSGEVATMFTSFRDNHMVRFSLRTGSWQVSDSVLGAGAYSEGHDSSTLLPEYKGVGILRGASDATPTVRTFLADGQDAERILLAARAHRERAGTLTGMAAGEDARRDGRDVMDDVRGCYYAGEAWVSWQQLAARLAEQHPEAYAGINAEAISAQVRAQGVPSVNGRDGSDGDRVLRGAKLAAVEAAITRQQISAS